MSVVICLGKKRPREIVITVIDGNKVQEDIRVLDYDEELTFDDVINKIKSAFIVKPKKMAKIKKGKINRANFTEIQLEKIKNVLPAYLGAKTWLEKQNLVKRVALEIGRPQKSVYMKFWRLSKLEAGSV